MFDEGISKSGSVLDMAETYGVTQKSGAWYYGEDKLARARRMPAYS